MINSCHAVQIELQGKTIYDLQFETNVYRWRRSLIAVIVLVELKILPLAMYRICGRSYFFKWVKKSKKYPHTKLNE